MSMTSAACGASGAATTGERAGPADMVLVGGVVLTMDPKAPTATALAIRGGRIAAVGSDAEVRALIGNDTRIIELAGRGVTPGLVDAHCHLYGLGVARSGVDLRGATSAAEAAGRAGQAVAEADAGAWVVGRGWDQNLWEIAQFPTASVLDQAVPNHPASLRRIDGHALWANSAAMKIAGVTAETPDPQGGLIVRDESGAPTGVFVDTAMDLIEDRIPAPSIPTQKARILAAAGEAVSHGFTGVHEMGISEQIAQAYRALADEGRLPLRVYGFLSGSVDDALKLPGRPPEVDRDGTQYFVIRSMKLFADGALGSRGAALLAPYSDDPDNSGLWITSGADLARAAEAAARGGWQLGVHAIGDGGIRAVLDAYEAAGRAYPSADLRFRVEHAQVIAMDDIARFAELGVIASMQPTHATSDMPWAPARLGAERLRGAYAWRSVLDSGAHLALGSDFPVEKVSPLLGIYAAVTRQDAAGSPPGGWFPEQRLTLEEAIAGFTIAPAYASFSENERGMLRSGYVADITVYDRPLAADRTLLDTVVDLTIVGGEVAFERQ